MLPNLTPQQTSYTYASEADMINVALFGMTARQWRTANPDAAGNIRDAASIEQLIVLSNLEGLNAEYIREGLAQPERLLRLNRIAKFQLKYRQLDADGKEDIDDLIDVKLAKLHRKA